MPRLTSAVPKYRKHKQSGQAIVTLSGRDFLLGPHGTQTSKLEYDRLVMEWLASGRSPSFGSPSEVFSVTQLVIDYARYAEGYFGKGPNEMRQPGRSSCRIRPIQK